MSYAIVWTRTALDRVEEIADHIAQDRPVAAQRMVRRLFGAIEDASETPWGAPAYLPAANAAVRQLVVKPYLVYYRIDDDPGQLTVLTVRHQRQRRGPIPDDE